MEIKILPSSKVRDHMARIIKELKEDGSFCFITQYGEAEAVLIDIQAYNKLIARLEDLEQKKDSKKTKSGPRVNKD